MRLRIKRKEIPWGLLDPTELLEAYPLPEKDKKWTNHERPPLVLEDLIIAAYFQKEAGGSIQAAHAWIEGGEPLSENGGEE